MHNLIAIIANGKNLANFFLIKCANAISVMKIMISNLNYYYIKDRIIDYVNKTIVNVIASNELKK